MWSGRGNSRLSPRLMGQTMSADTSVNVVIICRNVKSLSSRNEVKEMVMGVY